jgi:hypothetical protein
MWWQPKIIVKTIEIEKDSTESELSFKLANKLGDLTAVEITTEGVDQLFTQLSGVDGLLDYLADTMRADINRYFSAVTDKDRDIIRGAFSRTAFIRAALLDKLRK